MKTLDYIYHSGFALETEKVNVIIDYYKDSSESAHGQGLVHERLLRDPRRLYVLATHFHPDHFNPEVLAWKALHPDIRYIFSKDILKHKRAAAEAATYLRKGECYEDDCLRIEACGSTDVGSSFLIHLGDCLVFHAGDLNNWHWSETSTEQQIRKADGDFLAELAYVKEKAPAVDLALFPVDRRMGGDYMKGARQFVGQIKTAVFVPMHFGEDYAGGNAFREEAEKAGCRFLSISRRGESFPCFGQCPAH
ncbi:MAG: MBL fold metallo-hydrolase [Tannerella sp.]|jgi:L-ascorbate metabolism protein UlaG (beta-lactamase superfamily)|nr:MBL fold metallo-hydrolase [Tannerella sp.]